MKKKVAPRHKSCSTSSIKGVNHCFWRSFELLPRSLSERDTCMSIGQSQGLYSLCFLVNTSKIAGVRVELIQVQHSLPCSPLQSLGWTKVCTQCQPRCRYVSLLLPAAFARKCVPRPAAPSS